jgi:uncharacterized protein
VSPLVVVMAKAPAPGTVKTRLCPPLSTGEAAALAECLLLDTLHTASETGFSVRLALSGAWDAPTGTACVPQGEGDLGERMLRAFHGAFADGFGPVLMIGTDCPALRATDLQDARVALKSADVVLGPATDGGYYLIGLAAPPAPTLFDGIAWSTARTEAQTRRSAIAHGLSVATLPALSDLDTPADLALLAQAGPLATRWRETWRSPQ